MRSTLRVILTRPASDEAQLPLAVISGVLLLVGTLAWEFLTAMPSLSRAGQVMVWISLALGLIHGGKAAWSKLREITPDIDVLMVVGALLAASLGHPEEGALLLFLFNLAGALEHRALGKARDAVSRLHKLMPKNALRRDGARWVETDAEALLAGDLVLVRPGETIPADGLVRDGRSAINQSTLTGESLPRGVEPGDSVYAGTLNESGALEVEIQRLVAESSIQKILRLVLEAQERRQPLERLITRFSTPYTLTVFALALLVLFGFWLLPEEGAFADAAYRAITLLVVASPCALVIATPTATLCGLSRAARYGVLIKGGDALERLAGVRHVALDKTGTLTTGQIEVTRIEPVGASDVDSLLSIAMAAEQRSTHPIARAIVRLAESHLLAPAELASLSNVPGRGLEAIYHEQPLRIGTYAYCKELIPVCFHRHTEMIVEGVRREGGSPVVLAYDGQAMVLALSDRPRAGADELARELREVGVEGVTMLTGDQRSVAERIGRELGITDIHAELMPEDKVREIERLRETQSAQRDGRGAGGLAVIGDGVNDAPALAIADVGLAMGRIGADAALETADVVLLHDDLDRVPWSIGLARRVKRMMLANIIFALGVILTLGCWTLLGDMPLWLGVLGHEGSTLIVVGNSLRLLLHPAPASAIGTTPARHEPILPAPGPRTPRTPNPPDGDGDSPTDRPMKDNPHADLSPVEPRG